VEEKGARIAKVKRIVMESSMDCELQESVNSLPPEWRGEPNEAGERFLIPQHRNQDPEGSLIKLSLIEMSAPTFEEGSHQIKCNVEPAVEIQERERPLSAILDVKDEVLDKVLQLFMKKPVWKKTDLFSHPSLKQYTSKVLSYILQNAIDSGFQLKDRNGRIGHLQAKGNVFAFTFAENDTMLDKLLVRDTGTFVDLPVHVPVVAEAVAEAPVPISAAHTNLTAKREAYAWPAFVGDRFNAVVLDWYIADVVLTAKEKRDHLLTLNWADPPPYARPLLAKTSENTNLYILGSKEIYNNAKEKIVPVGVEEDAYRNWLRTAKDRFVASKADLFASIKDGGVIFNMDEKAEDVRRANRAKNIGGRQCTTYTAGLLDKFSEWLVGTGFPENVKTKKDRCLFLDLLVREAVLSGKPGIIWVTPEEYEIFSEDENRPDLLRRLKE
jgi:hypothetical protein